MDAPGVNFKETIMEKLKLLHPIKINGKEVKELTYDANEITSEAFIAAEARKFRAAGRQGVTAGALEMDYSMHRQLGFAAIVAVNPEIDYNDLSRLKGADVAAVVRIGRNFIMPSAVEESTDDLQENTSGNE